MTNTDTTTIPAIIPSNFDELKKVGETVVKSGFAPKGMETPEACIIAMQAGMEVGLPPLAALQNFAVVNGRPSLYGDAILAIVRSSGQLVDIKDETLTGKKEDDSGIEVTVTRSGQSPIVRSFTVGDAKRAGLWGKAGPWTQYPRRMLMLRARTFALRDGFADVLRGIACVEEQRDAMREVKGAVVAVNNPMAIVSDPAPAPAHPKEEEPADFALADDSATICDLDTLIRDRAKALGVSIDRVIADADKAQVIPSAKALGDLSTDEKQAILAS